MIANIPAEDYEIVCIGIYCKFVGEKPYAYLVVFTCFDVCGVGSVTVSGIVFVIDYENLVSYDSIFIIEDGVDNSFVAFVVGIEIDLGEVGLGLVDYAAYESIFVA